jgi:hypothetical protein
MILSKYKFNEPEFWIEVDSLTETRLNEIIENIGGKKLLHQKYTSKRYNSIYRHKMGISITEKDYACLVYAAGINLTDINKGGFNLARLNDTGPYDRGNCRFIPSAINMAEIKSYPATEKQIAASKNNVRKALASLTKEKLVSAGKRGNKTYWENKKAEFSVQHEIFLSTPVNLEFINYPKFGWKVRLSRELKVSKGIVNRFLRMNPGYVNSLIAP